MAYVLGTDIYSLSRPSDWTALYNAGCRFIFIKASENEFPDNYVNPSRNLDLKFSDAWQKAKAVGLLRGAYHFFHWEANNSAQQADVFIETVGADKGELPPVCDFEHIYRSGTAIDLPSVSTLSNRLRTWLQQVEAEFGCKPIIYTSASFINSTGINEHNTSWINDYPLWVAHYPWAPGTRHDYKDPDARLTASTNMPAQPVGFQPWSFWQWSAHGRMGGFPANQDVDFDYFNGSYDDLLHWKGRNSLPDPLVPDEPEYTTTTYVIEAGDTLMSIAEKFHISLVDLVNMNNDVLAKEESQLTVPGRPEPDPQPQPEPEPTENFVTYVVQENDNLGKIALDHIRQHHINIDMNSMIDAIMVANPDRIKNRNIIHAGWVLKIPIS